jgi:hypothetical protein
MKQNSIITLVAILSIAGLISYGIIWYRKKMASTGSATGTPSTGTATGINTGTGSATGTGYALPKINSYGWWTTKLGHANFPLGLGSRGVEVVKVQETLNVLTLAKRLNDSPLTVDGIWGPLTDARFKKLFYGFNSVTQYMFITEFDKNGEIL